MSQGSWERLKRVGDAAESGDEQAQESLAAIDAGTKTIYGAVVELREKTALPSHIGSVRTIPKKVAPAVALGKFCEQLDHYTAELGGIDVSQIDAAEAESLAGSLSRIRTVLSKTINQLRSIA